MAEKKSELQKLSDWMGSWGKNLYERTTGKTYPKKPERKSYAPQIYSTLTGGKEFPKDPNPIISQRNSSKPPKVKPPKAEPPKVKPPKVKPSASLSIPPSAAIPGEGPKGNTVGSDSNPETPGLQGPGAITSTTERTNANGLKSYGKDLSSLNTFTREFTGGYEIADINKAFQSEALPTTKAGEDQGHEAPRTNYSWDSEPETDVWDDEKGALIPPSVPGTTGGKPGNAQDGTSDKPDIAEEVRTIRMRRKGPRDDGGPRGFAIDRANEMAQNSVSTTKGNGMNARRREIRGTFLNHEGNSIQAITAARAVAGVGNDSDGSDVYNVGGKLVYAKAGEERKAINTLMSGNNPMAHLDMPETPDTQPDTPADTQLSMTDPIKDMTEEQQKKAAQLFAKGFVSDISGKLKDK